MDSTPEYPPHALGRRGEALAAQHLRTKGWRILFRNYRFGRREVDIIARKGHLLAFIEVKTRSGPGYGAPEEAITRLKRREIEAVAAHFLALNPSEDVDVRFDAVAVTLPGRGGRPRLRHIPDAWRPEWP